MCIPARYQRVDRIDALTDKFRPFDADKTLVKLYPVTTTPVGVLQCILAVEK
jgi:hypothetical protein